MNGETYDGQWEDDEKHGKGRGLLLDYICNHSLAGNWLFPNGDSYVGQLCMVT